jgi:hypothetical protein
MGRMISYAFRVHEPMKGTLVRETFQQTVAVVCRNCQQELDIAQSN